MAGEVRRRRLRSRAWKPDSLGAPAPADGARPADGQAIEDVARIGADALGGHLRRQEALNNQRGSELMSVAKVSEITSSSTKSFEEAIHEGIKRANKTLSGITGAWIAEQKVVVSKGKVTEYRVTMRVTFILKD
jgi:hypothetical protein